MKRVTCTTPYEFTLSDVPDPQANEGQAVIKIQRIGVCGTDLHAYKGNQPYFSYPRVLGHELGAEIVSLPKGATELQVGDKVAVIPYIACGDCVACRRGKTNCCVNLSVLGVHRDGGMQEYYPISPDYLISANDLSYDQLALVECMAIGCHAVQRAHVRPDATAIVMGAGPIGIGVMQFLGEVGLKVMVLDVNPKRLEFCQNMLPFVQPILVTEQVQQEVEDATNGDFADFVFDATGNQKAMEAGFAYVAHGGTYVLVGILKGNITFYDPDFHKRETTLMSSRNATPKDFEQVIASIRSGSIQPSRMITHHASLEETIEQFEQWLDPKMRVVKAMITCRD